MKYHVFFRFVSDNIKAEMFCFKFYTVLCVVELILSHHEHHELHPKQTFHVL